jgi:hypothetical protein
LEIESPTRTVDYAFIHEHKGSPAEYWAGLQCVIERKTA